MAKAGLTAVQLALHADGSEANEAKKNFKKSTTDDSALLIPSVAQASMPWLGVR